ncbi:MAG: hypothetical protein AB1758_14480 [Candidatus Eremiobacterota bacterium]
MLSRPEGLPATPAHEGTPFAYRLLKRRNFGILVHRELDVDPHFHVTAPDR